jgi:23S rRNA pseudouridine1911/1915/1917 synthase
MTAGTEPAEREMVADGGAANQRLDRWLASVVAELSRSRIKALIEAGHVRRDGATVRDPAEPVRPGARYVLAVPPPALAKPLPQRMDLSILYEDADLIVLDKPAGLVVHPAPGNLEGTLVNALLAHAEGELPVIGGEGRPGIVHRLDKDTSGVMVVAKTDRAHQGLARAFAARALERTYLALAWGVPGEQAFRIEAPIGRHPVDRKRMAVVPRGRPAATRVRLLRAHGTAVSLLACRLETGRTHQIRVHLAHAGHPIVGDPLYCRRLPAAARSLPAELAARLAGFPRQALHAATLAFAHPVTGALLRFETPPPPDLGALVNALWPELTEIPTSLV